MWLENCLKQWSFDYETTWIESTHFKMQVFKLKCYASHMISAPCTLYTFILNTVYKNTENLQHKQIKIYEAFLLLV